VNVFAIINVVVAAVRRHSGDCVYPIHHTSSF
jgi:hypothetical protein